MCMNLGFRQIFIMLAGLLLAINVPAQNIPLLPADQAVLKGVMPNGMAYYLVANPDEKGVADFALVQKTGLLTLEEGRAAEAAESAMDSLRRVPVPQNRGVVRITDDATVFKFDNIRLNALDSTLLMIMDMADRANYSRDEFVRKWYVPADQAIIVSGDIDTKSVAAKLTYMSYMVPAGKSVPRREYLRKEMPHEMNIVNKGGFTEISASWTSKRVPREYMNTVQPEIFEMSLHTLGEAASERIRKYLRERDVPAADVSYSHVCSSTYPYDDSFSIKVIVSEENAAEAEGAVAAVMSSIDAEGLFTNEYVSAENVYIQSLADKAAAPVRSNGEYVERCVDAFLYNASLASAKERLAFHSARNLPDTMRRRLFNGIASALIDTVCATLPEEPVMFSDIVMPDTLNAIPAPVKMKLKSSRKEPVSGGVIWTFSNGFKVIYKKMASDRMYYSLALNGGYGSIPELGAGEGAFVADYLKTCRIAGMDAEDFIKALRRENVSMDISVNLSNMLVSGTVPKEKMNLMLRSLLAVANERTADSLRLDYYKRSEYLALECSRGSAVSRKTAIDSIMCPGYRYSPYKVAGGMSGGFADRAEAYYEGRFAKADDGVLVIVGNMEEEALKKSLLAHLGHFRTGGAVSRKPSVRYQPVSGWSTYVVDGDSDNVDIAASAQMPLTLDNYIAANLAAMVLEHEMGRFIGLKWPDFSLQHNCRIYPEERLNMFLSVPSASLCDLAEVRSALSSVYAIPITDEYLKPYRQMLKNRVALEMKTPAYWIHAIALRYLDAKDLTTNHASRADAVSPERVKEIMRLLSGGSKVEYVTIKK